MNKRSCHLLATVALLAAMGCAQAHTTAGFTFDNLSVTDNILPALQQTDAHAGVTLTVSATTNSVPAKSASLAYNEYGLGVTLNSDSHGINAGDNIWLSFSKAVKLTSMSLSYWNNPGELGADQFRLEAYDASLQAIGSVVGTKTEQIGLFQLSSPLVGTTFKLTGLQGDFRLYNVCIDTAVPAVPEPATMALMGLGLVGLAFIRWRTTQRWTQQMQAGLSFGSPLQASEPRQTAGQQKAAASQPIA